MISANQAGAGALNHTELLDLPSGVGDPHTQYLLLAGRSGGQVAVGGDTATTRELGLQGAQVASGNRGLVRVNSPIVFDDVSDGNALSPYSISDTSTQSFSAAFIGGTFNASPTIDFSNSVFIWEALRGAPNIQSAVAPSFAAFTLFQALPLLRAGSGATHNPLQGFVMNAGITTQNEFAGTRTSANSIAVSWSPQTKVTTAGAVLNVTSQCGLRVSPTFSTVAGSTANMGTVAGVDCRQPAAALFQPSAGTELLQAYYGLRMRGITFASVGNKAAVLSELTAAADRFCILNTGGAESSFGTGTAGWSDGAGVELGTGDDVLLNWNGSAYEWDPATGPDMRWAPNAADYWALSGSAALQGLQLDLQTITLGGTAADPSSANFFVQYAAPNLRVPTADGEYSDVAHTAGGTLDVDGRTLGSVQAAKWSALSVLLNGGTIDDLSNVFIEAMSSFGATRFQALRVLGRTRVDGLMCHNESTLAQLTGHVASLALPANNGGRFVLREDADALGPWIIRGITNVQVGDAFYLINHGANAFVLGHQDAGAGAAAERIISPTGANLTLGPDEMAKLWYDPVDTRWRVLETTGA